MRVLKIALVMSPLMVIAACGRDEQPTLERDLAWLDSLAAQPAAPVQPVASPLELSALAVHAPAPAKEEAAPAEAEEERPVSRPRRSSSRRSSVGRSSSSGTYASAPARQPRVVEKKHTVRDAAIGAGVGAVAGAVIGGRRHRVRGAVIGGVVGGVAGAVIGNNVDKTRTIVY